MKEGHIDGFCVGEPWNSAATLAGDGWIAATSSSIAPRHPEKVLIVEDDLKRERAEEYAALRQAILTACRYCDTPQGRIELVDLFTARKLFPVSKEVLANSLIGPFQKGANQPPETGSFFYFSKNETNRATLDRALWTLEVLEQSPITLFDAEQRRACLKSFHDILPEQIKLTKRKPKQR
jgi:ABC-type nitrate/sulfonate/bicarbonate transport system substrate-binding protein